MVFVRENPITMDDNYRGTPISGNLHMVVLASGSFGMSLWYVGARELSQNNDDRISFMEFWQIHQINGDSLVYDQSHGL